MPIDCGLYRAEYLTSMFKFLIMSCHRFAENDAPLSEVTKDGKPHIDAYWWRKAWAASEDEASFNGMA